MKNTNKLTVGYRRITEKRDKAVLIDFGETKPVWLPLNRISLNETNYTISGPTELMTKKLEETKEASVKYNTRDLKRISLPDPSWENDKSIGVDVLICSLSNHYKVKKRLFFPKSQIEDCTVPHWMVDKKQKEAIKDVASIKKCSEDDLIVSLFTGKGLLKV